MSVLRQVSQISRQKLFLYNTPIKRLTKAIFRVTFYFFNRCKLSYTMLKNEVKYLKSWRIYGLTNPYNAAEYTEERQMEEIILKFSLIAYRRQIQIVSHKSLPYSHHFHLFNGSSRWPFTWQTETTHIQYIPNLSWKLRIFYIGLSFNINYSRNLQEKSY